MPTLQACRRPERVGMTSYESRREKKVVSLIHVNILRRVMKVVVFTAILLSNYTSSKTHSDT